MRDRRHAPPEPSRNGVASDPGPPPGSSAGRGSHRGFPGAFGRLLRTRVFYLFTACLLLLFAAISYYTRVLHPHFLLRMALKEAAAGNVSKAVLMSDALRDRGHVDHADSIIGSMVEIGTESSTGADPASAMRYIDALQTAGFYEQADEILDAYWEETFEGSGTAPDSIEVDIVALEHASGGLEILGSTACRLFTGNLFAAP